MVRLFVAITFYAAVFATVFLGVPWAVRPFLSPPAGLCPTGWTYAQLICDRYPMHLVDPGWLTNDLWWNVAETAARFCVLNFIGIILALAIFRFSRHEYPVV